MAWLVRGLLVLVYCRSTAVLGAAVRWCHRHHNWLLVGSSTGAFVWSRLLVVLIINAKLVLAHWVGEAIVRVSA